MRKIFLVCLIVLVSHVGFAQGSIDSDGGINANYLGDWIGYFTYDLGDGPLATYCVDASFAIGLLVIAIGMAVKYIRRGLKNRS